MRDSTSAARYRSATSEWRRAVLLLAGLALLIFAAGCGEAPATPTTAAVAVPTTAPAPTQVPNTSAPATATASTASGGQTGTPAYAHSADYSMITGQLQRQGSCWVVTYVSPLTDVAPDEYNNHLALLPGARWDPATVKDGSWVVVHGHPDPTSPQGKLMGCGITTYAVDSLAINSTAP